MEVITIKRKAPTLCPVCSHNLEISKLTCSYCHTKLEGEFQPCKFCQLPNEHLEFIETFIKCRGNIKDVEKELDISYPTVRNRLEAAIQALGYDTAGARNDIETREDILNALENGKISPQEAITQLKRIGK